MFNKFVTTLMMGCALIVMGCESMNNTEKGAGIGALTGAGIGGIVGHQGGHGWEGALIGGAAGAVAGGLFGNQMDQHQQQINAQHITIVQVAQMGKEGVPSNAIIDELRRTRSVYNLDSETIAYLKNNGIKDDVIDYMISTASRS